MANQVEEAALARYKAQKALADATHRYATQVWRSLDKSDLTASWEKQASSVVTAVTKAQVQAASGAAEYHRKVMTAQGGAVDLDGVINPSAFGGVAADGRPLSSLLYQPVITAKQAIADGASQTAAMAQGQRQFAAMASQQVRDAGRVADGLATFANKNTVGYYRMLNGPSCSRCAVLAGKFFRKNTGFQRHPYCDCVHVAAEDVNDSFAFDTRKAVEQGQVTGLKDAERKAILDGADPSRVINSRRGMDPAGLTTRDAAKRGTVRPTPEAIYRFAKDRAEALELLQKSGYLLPGPRTAVVKAAVPKIAVPKAAVPKLPDSFSKFSHGAPKTLEESMSGANTLKDRLNCQKSVIAAEMRRRGYDVTAKAGFGGYQSAASRWVGPTGRAPVRKSAETREILEKRFSEDPVGSRYCLEITWDKNRGMHIFSAEKTPSGIRYYDPQTGAEDVSFYWDKKSPGTSVSAFRIDNATPKSSAASSLRKA